MERFLLNNCCQCLSLRTGCFIIAYFELVLNAAAITGQGMVLLGRSQVLADEPHNPNERARQENMVAIGFGVLLALIVLVLLAFSVVLLVGLYRNRRAFVRAYLIYAVVFLVIYLIGILGSFSGFVDIRKSSMDVAVLLLNVYFVLVIRSYYYQMGEKRHPTLAPAPAPSPAPAVATEEKSTDDAA